jgi:hypothetical protein
MEVYQLMAKEFSNIFHLDFNEEGVHVLHEFIKSDDCKELPDKERDPLLFAGGCFLGECLIKKHGGQWRTEDNVPAVYLTDMEFAVYPTIRVLNQFRNGSSDSVKTLYKLVCSLPEHFIEFLQSLPEE